MRGSVSIERDRLWRLALMFEGLAEKGFGRGYIALRTEHKVHCLAGPIHPPVEIDPLATNLQRDSGGPGIT